jgi:4-hydroxy-L-threonine phosphate dehydrogenase PdxA
MRNKILLISGDPNSINSEIIYKCWKNLNKIKRKNIYIISNYLLLKKQFKLLKYSIKLFKVKDINENLYSNGLKILDVPLKFKNPFNVSFTSSSIFIKDTLNLAHNLAQGEKVKGIINCPIDKKLLKKNNLGITEYLAAKCKIKNNSEVMLIKSKDFSVLPITTHIKLKDVAKKINSKLILKKIITFNNWFKQTYKKKPKIGILGLNPHNAELVKNSEEHKIIIPTIKKLKKKGYKINGPLVPDTLFINNYKNYDVIVGMYHDQVLIPFKTIYKFDAVNVTLGLKYLRLSPDHGVAKNILKKKIANHLSLLNCINFLNKLK